MRGFKSLAETPTRTSRSRTPALQTPEESEYTSSMVPAELHQRLLELAVGVPLAKKDSFNQSVEVISMDRRVSNIQEREKALLDILTVLANKYEPGRISAKLLGHLVRAFASCRSDLEGLSALQAIAICLISIDDDCNDYDECHEMVALLLPKLLKRINTGNDSVQLRAYMTTCYAFLCYVMNFGGGGFQAEDLANSLVEIAEKTSDQEASLTVAALLGLGLVSTLAHDANHIIEDISLGLIQFLEMPSADVQVAAAKVVGLYIEMYTGDSLDRSEIIDALNSVLSESARRTAKKDKKERKSVLRDAVRTAENDAPSTIVHFALSKQRSLQIKTWKSLIIVQHLRWVYGSGLHAQVASNPTAAQLLAGGDFEHNSEHSNPLADTGQDTATDQDGTRERREIDRRRARLEKLEARGLVGGDAIADSIN